MNMQNVNVWNNTVSDLSALVKLNTTKNEILSHGGSVKVDVGKRNKNVDVKCNILSNCIHECRVE